MMSQKGFEAFSQLKTASNWRMDLKLMLWPSQTTPLAGG